MRIRFRRLQAFVVRHGMCDGVPVDLTRAQADYDVRFVPFSPATLGFSFQRIIAVNANLHPYEQRMVLAHEMAHKILEHPNSLFLSKLGDWWYDAFEIEAQKGAAYLLVPLKELLIFARGGMSMQEMEERLAVPAELITLRIQMGKLLL